MVEVEIEMHNEASCWKVTFPKGHAPQYMISRVFIPPWSLVMGEAENSWTRRSFLEERKPEP
jgi:hypothetical protein